MISKFRRRLLGVISAGLTVGVKLYKGLYVRWDDAFFLDKQKGEKEGEFPDPFS